MRAFNDGNYAGNPAIGRLRKGGNMACKMMCPNCHKVLKEEGDEIKGAWGEYRVYDSLWNSAIKDTGFRVLHCLVCNTIKPIEEWFSGE